MVLATYDVEASDGVMLHVTKVGQGKPVVIVHGSLSTSEDWRGVADALAPERTVHVFDRRGRGGSGDSEDYDLQTEVDDVVSVLRSLDEPATLVGHSYGAIVALEVARQHPIDALVLYEPPLAVNGPVAGDALGPYADAIASGDIDGALVIGLQEAIHVPAEGVGFLRTTPLWGQMSALAPTWTRELAQIDQRGGDVERYRDLQVPTTLILGEATPPHHVDATNALSRVLPNSTVVSLPGQGHFAHLEQPALLAAKIGSGLAV
jgi:pimeloyl-ACP methyl ester carboxylesterase